MDPLLSVQAGTEGDTAPRTRIPLPDLCVRLMLCLTVVSAAAPAAALLGVGAADAGLAPLLGPVQVEEDAADDGQDNGRND